MFHTRAGAGWIEVVVGSMFSGKSEELIRRLRRAQIAKRKVQIFKPRIDNRYSDTHITSHSAMQITADSRRQRARAAGTGPCRDRSGRHRRGGSSSTPSLPAVCSTLADQGKRIIVAGLDQDYLGKPFEPMPQLLAIAEYITKTLAICMVCGAPANHTQRLVASHERVVVGGQGTYEARCRHCFDPTVGAIGPRREAQGARRRRPGLPASRALRPRRHVPAHQLPAVLSLLEVRPNSIDGAPDLARPAAAAVPAVHLGGRGARRSSSSTSSPCSGCTRSMSSGKP
jgi:thymidine kinase